MKTSNHCHRLLHPPILQTVSNLPFWDAFGFLLLIAKGISIRTIPGKLKRHHQFFVFFFSSFSPLVWQTCPHGIGRTICPPVCSRPTNAWYVSNHVFYSCPLNNNRFHQLSNSHTCTQQRRTKCSIDSFHSGQIGATKSKAHFP